MLLLPSIAAASTNYTWTGAAASGTENWSDGTNWEGSAPSGTVSTLTFPALTSGACTGEPPTATCYESHNDVNGLNVNALAIDDGVGYFIEGNEIILGSGGITASPSANDYFGSPELGLPITLSAAQTWSIKSGAEAQELIVNGNVSSGTPDTLNVSFSGTSGFPFLDLYESNAEVGAVLVKGKGGVVVGKSLNGTDGNSVSLSEGAQLYSLFGRDTTIGPLTTTEDNGVFVGQIFEGGAGTLAVNGGVTFDSTSGLGVDINQPGTVAGVDFSQLSAAGAVNLGSAHLSLGDGEFGRENSCEALTPGDVDTLVTTTGSLTGTFSGIPNETTVPVECFGNGTSPTARINYTAHTVTATILTAGVAGPPIPTATALHISNAAPAIGEAVTYAATVTPEAFVNNEPSGSVEFLDGGQPIAGCAAQLLTQGASSSTAKCTLSYPAAGAHSITVSYLGAGHFDGSSSVPQNLNVQAGAGSSGGGATPPPPATTPAPTGRRARALKKCKKKHGKARAKCVKKAHKLPR